VNNTDPARLEIGRKDGREESVEVGVIPFVIGRKGADLDLRDASVSRRHCEISAADEKWIVRDLGSSNGTFLNGKRVETHALAEGDRLTLGRTEIVFRTGPLLPLTAADGRKRGLEDARLWSLIELGVTPANERDWLRSFLETVGKRFGAERAFIVEYEESGGVGRAVAGFGEDFDVGGPSGEPPLSRTIADQVVRERRPLVTTSADVDERFSEAQSVDKYEIKTVVCAPARWQGQAVGAVYLERRHGDVPYGERDAEELQDIADLLGIAMMAWRGHAIEHRQEWEKELLARVFSQDKIGSIIAAGGMKSVRRDVREVCIVRFGLANLHEIMDKGNDETWLAVSQIFALNNEIMQRHGGSVIRDGCAAFESGEGAEGSFAVEATRAAVEAQQAVRSAVKKITREWQTGISVGVGVSSGRMLVGFFGAGQQIDYHAVGEPGAIATALSQHAHDGEVLIDHSTHNKVRLFINTHRIAPISIPGVQQQVQIYRIIPY
jgi:adenylate cyclase